MNEDLGNDQEMDDEVDIAMNNEGDWMRISIRISIEISTKLRIIKRYMKCTI